ncbi:hypothetical protein QWY31_06965 [Cytophagales bacterium LB-30]|uniref:DUF4468 domain-containing protein n=1 Tax=Shiella aurantiaca TaxID=3058365 RepID=A0ABT8F4R1_9BACT|nr:hypothetical protein [Shiella aurantiaca]MDN4165234.1 hypothetical protein [Shiella aurantiaca]
MRPVFFLLFFLFFFSKGYSQEFPTEIWHEGMLVLESQDTLRGNIKYDIKGDIVQINIGNTIQTYSSRKILFFEIFDRTANRYRYFYSLPYYVNENYKTSILFEVLYEGELSLLCREELIQETVPAYTYAYRSSGYYSRYRMVYEYFFLGESGTIERYSEKKKDLLYRLRKYQYEIKQYIKSNRLRYDSKSDLIKIVEYYNELLSGQFKENTFEE